MTYTYIVHLFLDHQFVERDHSVIVNIFEQRPVIVCQRKILKLSNFKNSCRELSSHVILMNKIENFRTYNRMEEDEVEEMRINNIE